MAIKSSPSDFIVEEIPAPDFPVLQQPAAFALYELRKAGIDTPGACKFLARRLRLPSQAVVPAGLKDKHAQTTQRVSVRLPKDPGFDASAKAWGDGWSAQRIGWSDRPIDSSAIQGNRFVITLRRLSREQADRMHDRLLRLSPDAGQSLLFVNYFGAQRFGANRHGQGFAARLLCRGQAEAALRLIIGTPSRKDSPLLRNFKTQVERNWGRWPRALAGLPQIPEAAAVQTLARNPRGFIEAFASLPYFIQQINVEAYQSYLWNMTAVRLVDQYCAGHCFEAQDEYTPMRFPEPGAVDPRLRALDLPLLAPTTALSEPWADAAAAVLTEEQVRQDQLRVPGLRRHDLKEKSGSSWAAADTRRSCCGRWVSKPVHH